MKDLLLRAWVVVPTSNMETSRCHLADCVKKLRQKACRMCTTIIFPHSTNQIVDLWRCPCNSCRRFLNSLMNDLLLRARVVVRTSCAKNLRRHFADYVNKSFTKKRAARVARLFFLIQPIKSLICGVVVAVPVVVS